MEAEIRPVDKLLQRVCSERREEAGHGAWYYLLEEGRHGQEEMPLKDAYKEELEG